MSDSKSYTEDPLMSHPDDYPESEPERQQEGIDYGENPSGKIIPDSGKLDISQLDAWMEQQKMDDDLVTSSDLSYLQMLSVDPEGKTYDLDPETGRLTKKEEESRFRKYIRRHGRSGRGPTTVDGQSIGAVSIEPDSPEPKMDRSTELQVYNRLKNKYPGVGSKKLAHLLGVVEAVDPFGFADMLAAATSNDLREELQYLKEKHPWRVHGTEVVGALGGGVLLKGGGWILKKALGEAAFKKFMSSKALRAAIKTKKVLSLEHEVISNLGARATARVGKTGVGKKLISIEEANKFIGPKLQADATVLGPAKAAIASAFRMGPERGVAAGAYAVGQANKMHSLSENKELDVELLVDSTIIGTAFSTILALAPGGISQAYSLLGGLNKQRAALQNGVKEFIVKHNVFSGKNKEFWIPNRGDRSLLQILTNGKAAGFIIDKGEKAPKVMERVHSLTHGERFKEIVGSMKENSIEPISDLIGSKLKTVKDKMNYVMDALEKMRDDVTDFIDIHFKSAIDKDFATAGSNLKKAQEQHALGTRSTRIKETAERELGELLDDARLASLDKQAAKRSARKHAEGKASRLKEMKEELRAKKLERKATKLEAEDEADLITATILNIQKIALTGKWTPEKASAMGEIVKGYNVPREVLDRFFEGVRKLPGKESYNFKVLKEGASDELAEWLTKLLKNTRDTVKNEVKILVNSSMVSELGDEAAILAANKLDAPTGKQASEDLDSWIAYLKESIWSRRNTIRTAKEMEKASSKPIDTRLPRSRDSGLVKMNDVADDVNRAKIVMLTPIARKQAEATAKKIDGIKKQLADGKGNKEKLHDELESLLDAPSAKSNGDTIPMKDWGLNTLLDFKGTTASGVIMEKNIFNAMFLKGGTRSAERDDLQSLIGILRDKGDNVSYGDAEKFKKELFDYGYADKSNLNEGYIQVAHIVKDHIIRGGKRAIDILVKGKELSPKEASKMKRTIVEANSDLNILIPIRNIVAEEAAREGVKVAGKTLKLHVMDIPLGFVDPMLPVYRLAISSAINLTNKQKVIPRMYLAGADGLKAAEKYGTELYAFMGDNLRKAASLSEEAAKALADSKIPSRGIIVAKSVVNRGEDEVYKGDVLHNKPVNYADTERKKLKNYTEMYKEIKGKLAVPEKTREEILSSLGAISDYDETAAQGIAQRVMSDLRYISDNILTKETAHLTGEPLPSGTDIDNVMNAMNLLFWYKGGDPSRYIRDHIKNATLDSKTAKIFRDLRPQEYIEMVKGFAVTLAEFKKKNIEPDYDVQLALSNLVPEFDFSSPGLGILTGGVQEIAHAPSKDQGGDMKIKTHIGDRAESDTQSLENRKSKWK